MITLDMFEQWLKGQGYSSITPSGKPSVTYDYKKRVKRICDNENITVEELVRKIDTILPQYDIGGSKEEYGKKSHNAVISALRQFKRFIDDQS